MLVQVWALLSSFSAALYLAVCSQTILTTFCLCGMFVMGPGYAHPIAIFIWPLSSAWAPYFFGFC